jgi:SAM-dependent methyltransferase
MKICPCCQSNELTPIVRASNVPVQNTSLFHNETTARNVLKGELDIQFCERCGFLFNSAFDSGLSLYTKDYEETQGYSPTFQSFHKELADHLIKRYGLQDKRILELGCGKGEFLAILCDEGKNIGLGIDPAFRIDRHPDPGNAALNFKSNYYRKGDDISGFDLVCCKMTLEHIPNVHEFLSDIANGLGDKKVKLFFQIPDLQRILEDGAFWDIYYEHCSYFTRESLEYLFQSVGFKVDEIWSDFNDQYLMISADWAGTAYEIAVPPEYSNSPAARLGIFKKRLSGFQRDWLRFFKDFKQSGGTAVLWGGGSKAVAFLSFLNGPDSVVAVVDVNPNKQGTYLAGQGLPILAPYDLIELKPDVVIIMNPIYLEEIRESLKSIGLSPRVKTVLDCS